MGNMNPRLTTILNDTRSDERGKTNDSHFTSVENLNFGGDNYIDILTRSNAK